jgi:hypothetical protein
MKKILLLINDTVTGPYDIEILTKMELEKEMKIKYENETKWVTIEKFLNNYIEYTPLAKDPEPIQAFKSKLKLIRIKEKKVKHTRHSFFWFIHKFTSRHNINTIYITVLFIAFAIIITYLYFKYHLRVISLLF